MERTRGLSTLERARALNDDEVDACGANARAADVDAMARSMSVPCDSGAREDGDAGVGE